MNFSITSKNTVKIGVFEISNCDEKYLHSFYIAQNGSGEDEYFLIDWAQNLNVLDEDEVVLEGVYISKLSLRRDISEQIACFLEQNDFVEEGYRDDLVTSLCPLDISFFEVRYNFYKRQREENLDDISYLELEDKFLKVVCKNSDNSKTIVEDLALRKIIKNLVFM